MPGAPVKQGVRDHKIQPELEEIADWVNREASVVLKQLRGALNSKLTVTTVNHTVEPHEELILADASDGEVTVTLPFAATYFRRLVVKKVDSSANAVTVAAQSGETIEGQTSLSLEGQWAGVDVTPTGRDAEWAKANYTASTVILPVVTRPLVFETSDTSVTLQKAHAGNYLRFTADSPVTCAIPDDTGDPNVDFVVGDFVRLFQAGAGQVTLAKGDSGMTLNNPETLLFYKQFSSGIVTKYASRSWDVDIDAETA